MLLYSLFNFAGGQLPLLALPPASAHDSKLEKNIADVKFRIRNGLGVREAYLAYGTNIYSPISFSS